MCCIERIKVNCCKFTTHFEEVNWNNKKNLEQKLMTSKNQMDIL